MSAAEEYMEIITETWMNRQSMRLLCHLMRNAPIVVPFSDLHASLTGDRWCTPPANATQVVRTAICRLREQLDGYGYRPCVVTEVTGYRWDSARSELVNNEPAEVIIG